MIKFNVCVCVSIYIYIYYDIAFQKGKQSVILRESDLFSKVVCTFESFLKITFFLLF